MKVLLLLLFSLPVLADDTPYLINDPQFMELPSDTTWSVPTTLTIVGQNGDALVVVDLVTGDVTLNGDPNEAAKIFWEAVKHDLPLCKP